MSSILQFFYDLFHWQYFGILAVIWLVIDLAWVARWTHLIERIGALLKKPLIFEHDEESDKPPLYPRRPLEQLARIGRRDHNTAAQVSASSLPEDEDPFTRFIDSQRNLLFDHQKPLRSVGYVIALVLFIFFLIADAITIANTLVLMGVISADLPPILQRLDLAILGGAVLTAVVGVWMLIEMSGTGDLINADLNDAQKKIFKVFSVTVTLFAIAVMLALAVQRLISLGFLDSSPTMSIILSFVLYGILAINNSLSAALIFQPAVSGLIVVIYLLVIIIPVLAFFIDLIGRFLYIVIDMVMWLVFTPFIAIPFSISKIFGWIK